jgi:hypothetical protein
MSYGIILWAGSSHAKKVFILQNKIIRIIMNTKPRYSCRNIFRILEIMMLYSLYIYSLLLSVNNNKLVFSFNNEIHKYRTIFHSNLHMPSVNTIKFEKGAYISGIKVFSHLPPSIKILANDEKSFKSAPKRFLCHHSFYSIN